MDASLHPPLRQKKGETRSETQRCAGKVSPRSPFLSAVGYFFSPLIASTGQLSAQSPQSVHLPASITYWSLPSLMAPTGHKSSQAPQEIQSSVISCAISFSPYQFYYGRGKDHGLFRSSTF
jgi:hypothetical protein